MMTPSQSGHDSLFDEPLDILVLMGGPSDEREVSLASGTAIADALTLRGHNVRRADIGPLHTEALDAEGIDVVFIALHGEFGEDGQIQRLCEQRGLAYVGSPPHASELALDKAASKQVYRKVGIDTPEWVVVEEFDRPTKQAALIDRVGLPCVLKPVAGGSSIDITIARSADERHSALEYLLDKYTRAMVEQYVEGREFTVGVIDTRALPVMEIRSRRDFYDYTAKYSDDATEYIADHGLDDASVKAMQNAALGAHGALGCRDLSRSDFLTDNDGRCWMIEINTIPGFTSHSLLPKAAAVAGIDFATLCEMLVKMAVDRHVLAESRLSPSVDAD